MINLISYFVFIIGSFCILTGSLGLIRMPDVYNRLHASTVIVVGGTVSLILGAGLLNGADSYLLKSLAIIFFIFITVPAGSHAISRAAHLRGVELDKSSVVDELEERERSASEW